MKLRCLFVISLCLVLLLCRAVQGEEAPENVLTRGPYEYVLLPDGDAEIIRYSGSEARLTVPSALDGHPVAAIRDHAFSPGEDWQMTSVTIPAGVTVVGANPFADCLALTRITVAGDNPALTVADGALYDRQTGTLIACPAATESTRITVLPGTKIIGDSAFSNCSGIVSLDLPEGLVSIGSGAFMACTSLTDAKLPDSLTEIGENAFCLCSALTDVRLPEQLTRLGRDAFSGCSSLLSVTIPDSLTDVPCNPFTFCNVLDRFVLSEAHPTLRLADGILYDQRASRLICYPSSKKDDSFTTPAWVREIGAYAFSSHRLTAVTLSEGVAEIGTGAFTGCPFLAEVKLPESLRTIGDGAFASLIHLNGIELPDGLARIGRNAFYHCGITEVILPRGIAEIAEDSFAFCSALKEISFSPTLRQIGSRAFYCCDSLTAVSLPEGLMRIDDRAFARCGSLNNVTLPKGLSGIGQDAFWRCGNDLVFTVPAEGGYAEAFCRSHGYTFAHADAPAVLIGEDTNALRVLAHPDLQGRTIGRDQMDLYVYWVQVRLKASGRWYQGDEWDCTGNLGSHTMSEINAFMQAVAGCAHDGTVDDSVIDALLDIPDAPEVLIGGFYDCLNTLTGGDRYGDMTKVDRSSSVGAIVWVQTCLKGLGFYTSSIDGKFGSGTLRALHAFQKEYGWAERDHVSYGVARDMLERFVASGGDPGTLP